MTEYCPNGYCDWYVKCTPADRKDCSAYKSTLSFQDRVNLDILRGMELTRTSDSYSTKFRSDSD